MDFLAMTASQLNAYALEKGIDVSGAKTKEAKIKAIADAEGTGSATVTALGVTVDVNVEAFDDFDMIEDLAALQDGDVLVLPRLVKRLFGEEFPRIKAALADEGGKLTATKAAEFFGAVIEAANAKN